MNDLYKMVKVYCTKDFLFSKINTIMKKKNYKKESHYVDPQIKVVKIAGNPILADSTPSSCAWIPVN